MTREEAMNVLKANYPDPCFSDLRKAVDIAIKALEEPEHKKGHWIFVHPLQKDDPGAYMCSVCKNGNWDIEPTDKYCKFCGADMRSRKLQYGDNDTLQGGLMSAT